MTEQRTRVTADGKTLLDSTDGLCENVTGLPSKSATYRISTDAARSTKVAGVTPRLTAAWTFRSKRTSTDTYTVLPLSSVRFAPKLDLRSSAEAGKKLTVPLTLQGPAAKKPQGAASTPCPQRFREDGVRIACDREPGVAP
ncbi:hypothetical protein [Streptomyces heilongjiangensis]|uniref:Uncharacterized protein n=1 Tax=Streptomyces heilongjiangensis TaxID=945052 RepID=A0ABW1B7F9_9ACTN|nr:hypothetical protein [Streptomyces heilongjiangensis]MDC2947371.1 hypothetical protein [Streptomyces heilongjiangensis]